MHRVEMIESRLECPTCNKMVVVKRGCKTATCKHCGGVFTLELKTKFTPNTKTRKSRVAIVLDGSGSMDSVRQETIDGYNEQLQSLRSAAKSTDVDTRVSVYIFRDHEVECVCRNRDVNNVDKLTREDYRPAGLTPMLDAVGRAICDLQEDAGAHDACLVVTISDGCENSSKEYSYVSLGEMIKRKQKTGQWTFTYMGANQDLSVVTEILHIPKGNTSIWRNDSRGTKKMFDTNAVSTVAYLSAVGAGASCSLDFYSGDGESDS